MKPYSFLTENNQTISRTKKSAHQFGYNYWKSGRKQNDNNLGIYHIYRTNVDDEGNVKIKRIKKEVQKNKKEKTKSTPAED